jgi:hypothetical protein
MEPPAPRRKEVSLKLLLGLAGGITVGSAATVFVTDPIAMQAVGTAFNTLDPDDTMRAVDAFGEFTKESWPLYAAVWITILLWHSGKPMWGAAGQWLFLLAERHHAREVRRQRLDRLARSAAIRPAPKPQEEPDAGSP